MFILRTFYYLLVVIAFCECIKSENQDTADIIDASIEHDYVDPHSFYYNKHDKKEVEKVLQHIEPKLKGKTCQQICADCLKEHSKDIPDELFSRRLINKLLSTVTFEEDDDLLVGNVVLELTHQELTRLRNFGTGKGTIREIDAMVSNIFRPPETTIFMDIHSLLNTFLSKSHYMYGSYIWPNKELLFGFILLVHMTWLLLRTRWSYFKMILIFLMIAFLASFIITYFQLLKEAEIKLTAKQFQYHEMPVSCQPHKMNWLQKIGYFFTSDEHCVKYYEAVMEDHRLHVTPIQVLSRVIGTFILEPAGLIGTALADFVHHATGRMSTPVQWIVQPLLVIAMIMAIIIGVVFVLSAFTRSMIMSPFSALWNLTRSNSQEEPRPLISKGQREPIEVILNLKVATDTRGHMAITHDPETHQLAMVQDKIVKEEELRTPKKSGHPAGGDADQPDSSPMKYESPQNSSMMDELHNEALLRELDHAGGDVNITLRNKNEHCKISEGIDGGDN